MALFKTLWEASKVFEPAALVVADVKALALREYAELQVLFLYRSGYIWRLKRGDCLKRGRSYPTEWFVTSCFTQTTHS